MKNDFKLVLFVWTMALVTGVIGGLLAKSINDFMLLAQLCGLL